MLFSITILTLSCVFSPIQAKKHHGKIKHSHAAKQEEEAAKRQFPVEDHIENHFPLGSHHQAHYNCEHPPCIQAAPFASFYSQECNSRKKCPKDKYCVKFLCEDCLQENMACTGKGQCCEGLCTYGRCRKVPMKSLGTFCDRHDDCNKDGCCLRVPAVNSHYSICKPKLESYQACGPHSEFNVAALQMSATGAEDTMCGPCADGLKCMRKGIFEELSLCTSPKKYTN